VDIARSWSPRADSDRDKLASTRASHQRGADTRISNCTIVVLFAGFYIEAYINHIIRVLKKRRRFDAFMGRRRYPGLQDKLAWFYNDFISPVPALDLDTARKHGIDRRVRRRFPGFAKLHRFRNDISHGVVNHSGRSVSEAQQLRQQAKTIVSELLAVLEQRGHRIRRTMSYRKAIQQAP
jgi:hypothetical protein